MYIPRPSGSVRFKPLEAPLSLDILPAYPEGAIALQGGIAPPREQLVDLTLAEKCRSGHPKADYLFVSNVRFLAMIAIVGVHTVGLWGDRMAPPASYLQVILIQAMKFGTIGFFLISGYLLGEGLARTSRKKYFYRRVKAVFIPWVFWSCVWFVIAFWTWRSVGGPRFTFSSLHELARQYLFFVCTKSIYWFVPNFLFCLALVMCLYKRLPDYVQGPLFLAFSVFYGLNAYLKLVSVRHTSALLGFVFYLWLGQFAYKNRDIWERWMDRIPWTYLAISAAVAAVFSLGELHLLLKLRSVDEFNTLRLSNQAFSVLMALLIVKSRRSLFPATIYVRSETFGIFLIHPILLQVVQIYADRIPVRLGINSNGSLLILLALGMFAVIYLLSLTLTKLLRRVSFLKWAVGQ